jgi:hypothetical protein
MGISRVGWHHNHLTLAGPVASVLLACRLLTRLRPNCDVDQPLDKLQYLNTVTLLIKEQEFSVDLSECEKEQVRFHPV